MNRWLFLWRRLNRELWVRAGAYAALGVGAALLAAVAAPLTPPAMTERFGGESVEEILTILASSLLAVATFSVGAMVTAYTAVSAQATPRVAALVTSDEQTQKSLSTFVGAFLYAIVAVTAINARYYGEGGRAILFFCSLIVVAVVAFRLLAWINRLSNLARVGHMVDLVETRARAALMERARRPRLGAAAGVLRRGVEIMSERTGHVQNVDVDRLNDQAAAGGFRVQVLAVPGAFVRRGQALARIDADSCDDACLDDLRAAFAIGHTRSFDQDPRFGLIVLAEIGAKALSPGVNDPGTAIQVIGAGVRLLDEWGHAERDAEVRFGQVLWPELSPADMLDDVFGPVARYGAGDVAVMVRLKKALTSLRSCDDLAAPARAMVAEVDARARKTLPIAADVRRVVNAGEP